MKIKALKYLLLLPLMYIAFGATAQETRADSLLRVEKKNSEYLGDLQAKKEGTKAKAKEAQRVERNATDAARESKIAYRTERKAQNARKNADRQAKKAKKARVHSDKDAIKDDN